LITSAERIAVENKWFRGLGTKNGSYWKPRKELVPRMEVNLPERTRRIFHMDKCTTNTAYHDSGEGDHQTLII